jgi:hypothetical protein
MACAIALPLSLEGWLAYSERMRNEVKMDKRTVRELFRYTYEGGGYVQAVIAGTISTEEALAMIERQIAIKREELGRAHPSSVTRYPGERMRNEVKG